MMQPKKRLDLLNINDLISMQTCAPNSGSLNNIEVCQWLMKTLILAAITTTIIQESRAFLRTRPQNEVLVEVRSAPT